MRVSVRSYVLHERGEHDGRDSAVCERLVEGATSRVVRRDEQRHLGHGEGERGGEGEGEGEGGGEGESEGEGEGEGEGESEGESEG